MVPNFAYNRSLFRSSSIGPDFQIVSVLAKIILLIVFKIALCYTLNESIPQNSVYILILERRKDLSVTTSV